ncbi:Threonine/homoserine/homoserine lactone efflux protein [Natronoarchaeum philippinense]|uniref:Threonine/homoserine/homoserine lactone efflux protein n=1 Tax=Natronoarchaeum philippinense TaxID=558529 RepID=A0A285N0W3_NATPI|nr:LysE family transporter [Natronoarchaeum philippinense]SNZ03105.1 Threonine/homoserine/homoserine lactone efflux protein [Natronoarchaeum philippinense]
MPSLAVSAVVGAVFGVVLAAPPGPMNAVIAEESVLRGWPAGFRAGLGAMLADALFFVLAVVGLVAVVDRTPSLRSGLYLLGGLLMLYFAVGALRDASAAQSFTGDVGGDSKGFRKAFALALTNPYQIAFWLTAGVGLIEPGRLDVLGYAPAVGDALAGTLVIQTGSPALLLGFFAGIGLWVVAYPAALVAAGRRVDAAAPVVAGLSGVVLAGFGAAFLWIGTTGLA